MKCKPAEHDLREPPEDAIFGRGGGGYMTTQAIGASTMRAANVGQGGGVGAAHSKCCVPSGS